MKQLSGTLWSPLLLLPCLLFLLDCADLNANPEVENLAVEDQGSVSAQHLLTEIKAELTKHWPKNRTIRFVFHGHSVPAGYFKAPTIKRFDAYPHLFQKQLCEQYPTAAIDMCITAIGGENSQAGAERFEEEVLALQPDVVFLDYSLNDRSIGLERASTAWQEMIEHCQRQNTLVVLLTPTPDLREDLLDSNTPLAAQAEQVRQLGKRYQIPVIDSYELFRQKVEQGAKVQDFLSQPNHPNRAGHLIVAQALSQLFAPN